MKGESSKYRHMGFLVPLRENDKNPYPNFYIL